MTCYILVMWSFSSRHHSMVMDPEMLARLVFCFENNPERHDGIISGAQDSIGICVPGLVRHYYDNNFWPEKIESTQDEMTLRFLEDHLVMIPLEPRRPGSRINSFYFFVLSLFVIGCGLTCLETSANPYTTVLGHPDKAESRINLSQSLNGIGWIVGPLVGGQLLFSGVNIAIPYALVGIFVLSVALVLLVCAILTFVATLIVLVCSSTLSLIAFFALYLGESIMFPTIFSLALRDAGTKTKLASSLLIMTIVGGAVAPVIMGYIADTTGSMAIAFLIPLVCYGVIGTYAAMPRCSSTDVERG